MHVPGTDADRMHEVLVLADFHEHTRNDERIPDDEAYPGGRVAHG